MATVENTIPVLCVSNLAESIRFYADVLGFSVDWGGEEGSTVCSVSRDNCPLMLLQGDHPGGAWVWIGLENDALFDIVQERARIHQKPRNNPWAYEMKVLDPDDNVLWLGTGPKDIPRT